MLYWTDGAIALLDGAGKSLLAAFYTKYNEKMPVLKSLSKSLIRFKSAMDVIFDWRCRKQRGKVRWCMLHEVLSCYCTPTHLLLVYTVGITQNSDRKTKLFKFSTVAGFTV